MAENLLVTSRHKEIVYFIKICINNMKRDGYTWEETTQATLISDEELFHLVKAEYSEEMAGIEFD